MSNANGLVLCDAHAKRDRHRPAAASGRLLVEGKRTEELSEQTSWLPGRNQLARNLEAAAHADGDTVVILATEHPVELDVQRLVAEGCPHVTDATERAAIAARFLGQATWEQLCVATAVDKRSLPEAIAVTPAAG